MKVSAILKRNLISMMRIDRILCPVNVPLEFDEAVRCAASLAAVYRAKLTICHCLASSPLFEVPGAGARVGVIRKELEDALRRYLGPSFSQMAELVVVDSGKDIGDQIVNTARDGSVDLIVMRSRQSRVAALLGSTAEQVSRTASCPVLVIHPREQQDGGSNERPEVERLLICHDFSSSAELALSYGLSMAQKYGAELHVIHVLPEQMQDGPERGQGQTGDDTAYHRAARRLRDAIPEEVYKRRSVTLIVRWGKPYREVLAYAREQEMDLVCMGALGRDFGLEALFGSNVDRVLRQSPCPVLIARPLKLAPPLSLVSAAEPSFKKTLFFPTTLVTGAICILQCSNGLLIG